MLKFEKHCYIPLASRVCITMCTKNNNSIIVPYIVYSIGVLKAPPCTYLNVDFTNKEEIVILVNEKIRRLGENLR